MKTIFYLFSLICCNLSTNVNAQTSVKEKDVEKTKKYTQSYDLSTTDKVFIGNKFGNITIKTWSDSKVKVDVEIQVAAKTEVKATSILDGIEIKHSKNNGTVSFKTQIENATNNVTTRRINSTTTVKKKTNEEGETVDVVGEDDNCNCNYGKNTQSMKINYTVYLPTTTKLKLLNEFGNTILDNYKGILSIKNEYGNLTAGELANTENEIEIEYGNADIKSVINPDVKVSYGNCDILNIAGSGIMEFNYSSDVTIGLSKEVGDLKIDNDYSTIEITVDEAANASFIVKSSYGEVKNKNKNFELTMEKEDEGYYNFIKKHEGKIGSGKAKIKIDNSYGKIKFR
jgi:hypothetical protein